MTTQQTMTLTRLAEMKSAGQKIIMLTAYDYLTSRLMDDAGVDILLVGDSLGMVFQGEKTTLPVTLEQMIYHTRIVARAAQRALVISDMPFLSYQTSPDDAVRNAGLLMKQGGAHAVKLEGGAEFAPTIARLVQSGIPVMGHIGFKPQSTYQYGTRIVQGLDDTSARKLQSDFQAVEQAGAFSIVLEAIAWQVAAEITRRAKIPTIGIGAGKDCDGQVLVSADMLGLFSQFKPRFVKRYAELGKTITDATTRFIDDVRQGQFPDLDHSYGAKGKDSD